jgi:hypothetical protein
MSSIGLFDTSTQANESTRVASEWVRDEKLERIFQNPPKVTDGEVIVHKTNGAVRGKPPARRREGPRPRALSCHGTSDEDDHDDRVSPSGRTPPLTRGSIR